MSNQHLDELLQRRAQLLGEIEQQRGELESIGQKFSLPISVGDQLLNALRFVRQHPLVFAGAAALFVINRNGFLGVIRLAWRAWKGYRFLTKLAHKLPWGK